jgi:ATP-dependent RNA circularization protein (DNA/RNA ligase family)
MKTNPKQVSLERRILPEFPRTPHLPYKPNLGEGDVVAGDIQELFGTLVTIEEKIDGASVGMVLLDGEPLVRNRDHILRKGFVKDTAAKKQFAPLWNWIYDNKQKLEAVGPFTIFGEWMWAQHGIYYDRLPDWFIPYDLFDYEAGKFVSPMVAREILTKAGLTVPDLRFQGYFDECEGSYEDLECLANLTSAWSNEKSEGIYIKAHNPQYLTGRYKMVREDYQRGALWNPKKLNKNKVLS